MSVNANPSCLGSPREGWARWFRVFVVSAFARIVRHHSIFNTYVYKYILQQRAQKCPSGYREPAQRCRMRIRIYIYIMPKSTALVAAYLHGILFDTSTRGVCKNAKKTHIIRWQSSDGLVVHYMDSPAITHPMYYMRSNVNTPHSRTGGICLMMLFLLLIFAYQMQLRVRPFLYKVNTPKMCD